MFEINFLFYIKGERKDEFYSWLDLQKLSEVNSLLPEGVRVLSLSSRISGDPNLVEVRLEVGEMNLIGKVHVASSTPGFLKTVQDNTDKGRDVITMLLKKLL